MRMYGSPIAAALVLAALSPGRAGEWGPPSGSLHCRLQLTQQVFVPGERIHVDFRIERVKGVPKEVEDLIPMEHPGLIEGLRVISPEGKRLPMTAEVVHPPRGKFYTAFYVSEYYDFGKVGEYTITAHYAPMGTTAIVLRSQTVKIAVVPKDFILISARAGARKFKPDGPCPLTVALSTGCYDRVPVEHVRIAFVSGEIWSSPLKNSPVPSRLVLTRRHRTYTFDLSTTGWDRGFSSIWPSKPLAGLVKPGGKYELVCEIMGEWRGKRFRFKSKPITIRFSP